MATLNELREWEHQVKSYWIDALLRVDEMLEMNADDPDRGCIEALRDAQDEALQAWRGKHDNVQTGQRLFYHRAKCVSAAALGAYTKAMEGELARA